MHLWEDRFDVITDDVKIKSRKPEAKPVAGGMASMEAGLAFFLLTILYWRPGIPGHRHARVCVCNMRSCVCADLHTPTQAYSLMSCVYMGVPECVRACMDGYLQCCSEVWSGAVGNTEDVDQAC